jgi:hypothetical protein
VGVQQIDPDTAESTAGVVRLLRRAAELAWAQSDAQGAGSPRQLLALGIDLAADEARSLLSDAVNLADPMPVGADPVGLLRSAELLLRRLCVAGAPARLHNLRARVVELVWEANTGVGA